MDINNITQLISGVGFPIVCVIFMWRYISGSMQEVVKSLSEITITMNKMCDRLDDLERKINE